MESSPSEYWFTYQPILDRQHQSVAIALLHRPPAASDNGSEAVARMVVDAYLNAELVELIGSRKVFVNVDARFLENGMASILPAPKVVLTLVNHHQFTDETEPLCREFKGMGYSLALADYIPTERASALLDYVDIVKVDIKATPKEKIAEIARALGDRPIRLLAEKVESQEDFDYSYDLGFDLFQGYYFARPKLLVGRRADPKRTNILNILSRIDQDASDREIEDALKQSPDLTLHLLRLVNSAAFGMHTRIGSIREALSLFGRSKLGTWLHILLFLSEEASGIEWALFEMAARRGRMVEMLVQDVTRQAGSTQQDRGFMVGMLSLVDVLLGAPLEDVLPKIGVVEDIQQAILAKSGLLGTLLTLCEALEIADFDTVIMVAGKCNISLARIMELQREATLWANAIAVESTAMFKR